MVNSSVSLYPVCSLTIFPDPDTESLLGCVQQDLIEVPGQSSRGNISKEKRYPPSMQERAHSSECGEVDVGVALEMFPPTRPHEVFTGPFGHTSNLDNSPALDSVGTRESALSLENVRLTLIHF